MRVLVCGGRDYDDWDTLSKKLNTYHFFYGFSCLIHGGASGADCMAGMWARAHEIPEEVYKADWQQYKRSAGIIRNKRMLIDGKPDLVIAFPGGKGTNNMVALATKAGILTELVNSVPVTGT